MSDGALGALAFGLFAGALALWIRRLRAVALGGRRTLPFAMCGAAAVAGAVALAGEPGFFGGALAAIGLLGGLVWIALGLMAGQSTSSPHVRVGGPLPTLAAPDETGARFDVASLRGHPVLIKLFRGHW